MTAGRLAHAVARARGLDAPAHVDGLERFEHRGLAILHGPAPVDSAKPDLDLVRSYAEAVDRAHRAEAVLPLRYGCVVEPEAGLSAMIDLHREGWLAALDEVEGCDEMGLRLLLEDAPGATANPPGPTPGGGGAVRPGAAYLAGIRARVAAEETRRSAAAPASASILEALGGLARRAEVEAPGPGRERLLSFAFLVPRDRLEDFRLAAGGLAGRVPGRLLLTGPWPPYHFAGPARVDPE